MHSHGAWRRTDICKLPSGRREESLRPTQDFWGVLHKWQWMWMWDNLQWVGEDDWLALAISDEECCIAVTDGSYMHELHANVNSAAVVIECTKGRGRLWCSFPETSQAAIMAIHLLLLAINKVHPDLKLSLIHI